MSDSDRDFIRELLKDDIAEEHGQHILEITKASRERGRDPLLEALGQGYQAKAQAKAEEAEQE